jgi:hypothetical protein
MYMSSPSHSTLSLAPTELHTQEFHISHTDTPSVPSIQPIPNPQLPAIFHLGFMDPSLPLCFPVLNPCA